MNQHSNFNWVQCLFESLSRLRVKIHHKSISLAIYEGTHQWPAHSFNEAPAMRTPFHTMAPSFCALIILAMYKWPTLWHVQMHYTEWNAYICWWILSHLFWKVQWKINYIFGSVWFSSKLAISHYTLNQFTRFPGVPFFRYHIWHYNVTLLPCIYDDNQTEVSQKHLDNVDCRFYCFAPISSDVTRW